MRTSVTTITVLAVLATLTGCSASADPDLSTSPTPDSTELGEIVTIDELVDGYVAAGGDCADWDQADQVSAAVASGNCSTSSVLMMFDSASTRDATADTLLAMTLEGETSSILVGPNWIINSEDVELVSTTLGGDLRTSVTDAEPAPAPFARQEFSGSGDMVQEVGEITDVAIVTFTCADCTSNTVLKSNGDESLLVNEIGAYSGSHAINLYENSMTTRFEIESTGSWTLVIDSIESAPAYDGDASGNGDSVFFMTSDFSAAQITNEGDSNFTVHAYGTGDSSLIVNEIGAYSGVKAMSGPALVQVGSTGAWSIAPQ